MPVYVAAPWEDGAIVRMMVHPALLERGLEPTSTWCAQADGEREDFARLTRAAKAAAAQQNDHDIHRAEVVIVLARPGAGGEMFAEARYALALGKRVVWVGREILSASRDGVMRAGSIDEAFEVLSRMAEAT